MNLLSIFLFEPIMKNKIKILLTTSVILVTGAAIALFSFKKNTNLNLKATGAMQKVLPNFTLRTLDGQEINTDSLRGKKIIILNVASECGYTPQYEVWQEYYEANKDKVIVLGFPCNDFGGQEPGDAGTIQTFCQKNYGVTFPILEKVEVSGANQAPIYQWLTSPEKNGWNDQVPTWNFCKYVIDEEGKLVNFFGSNVLPDALLAAG